MANKILILTSGLPRSSKSTWAKTTGFPMVNPDSIRLSLHGQPFIPEAEPMVWTIARYMVESLFLAGHDKIILDACSHTEHRRKAWISSKWELYIKLFDTSVEECIRRAKLNNQEYLIPVIQRMSKEWEPPHSKWKHYGH